MEEIHTDISAGDEHEMNGISHNGNGAIINNNNNNNNHHPSSSSPSATTPQDGGGFERMSGGLTFPKLNEIRRPQPDTNETSICYQFEDNDIPILIRYPIPPDKITLRDLKKALNISPNADYKFFFRSFDKDLGHVNEEISEDSAKLPIFKCKVVVVIQGTGEGSDHTGSSNHHLHHRRHRQYASSAFTDGDSSAGTESMISSRRGGQYLGRNRNYKHHRNHHSGYGYTDSSIPTSDRDSSIISDDDDTFRDDIDSDEDDDYYSRISSTTEDTSVSRQRAYPRKKWEMSRTSSVTSFNEAENVEAIHVRLDFERAPFLGIALIGPEKGGIFINEIMKGGVVDLDGRIENSDKILQVNNVDFSKLTNDQAVQVIQEAVKLRQPIDMLILKTSQLNMRKHFTIPRSDPVRPIDPEAWVLHTEASRAHYKNHDDYPTSQSSVTMSMEHMNLVGLGASGNGSQQYNSHHPPLPPSHHHHHHHPPPPPHHPSFGAINYGGTMPPVGFGSAGSPDSPLRRSMRSQFPVGLLPAGQQAPSQPPIAQPSTNMAPMSAIMGAQSQQPNASAMLHDQQQQQQQQQTQTAQLQKLSLTVDSDPEMIVRAMATPKYGLDVRERVWLKIRIPYAFIGTDAVKWLYKCVHGFRDKKAAKKFATQLLKDGLIEHAVSPSKNFSKNCYYIFSNDILSQVQLLSLSTDSGPFSEHYLAQQQQQQAAQHPPHGLQQMATGQRPQNFGNNGQCLVPNDSKPGSYIVRFIRNWDETSEFHNYGYFGPEACDDGSRVSGEINQRDQFSDEQSTRSVQSVLQNPNLKATMTNTIRSNDSANSRHTANSCGKPPPQQPNLPQHLLAPSGNGANILNHHYEDLQINPVTGNLMPTSPTSSSCSIF